MALTMHTMLFDALFRKEIRRSLYNTYLIPAISSPTTVSDMSFQLATVCGNPLPNPLLCLLVILRIFVISDNTIWRG